MIDYDSGRKLATLEEVRDLQPIPDADRIEVAVVRGWRVVVPKGSVKVGDRVVYFEIDTALPLQDGEGHYDFLAPRGKKEVDGRFYHILRTIRLRGVYSQGLVLPAWEVEHALGEGYFSQVEVGRDLTKALGLGKYEPPVPVNSGSIVGPFLKGYARPTDAERAQNLTDAWGEIRRGGTWLATEKLDGTSATLVRDNEGILRMCSRNWEIARGDNLYWNTALKWFGSDDDIKLDLGEAVQFEIVGPGIQGNPLGLKEVRPFVFGVVSGRLSRLNHSDERFFDFLAPAYDQLELPETVEEAIAQVDGIKSMASPGRKAEGVVWHQLTGDPLPELDYRTCFKVISNAYLLKGEK